MQMRFVVSFLMGIATMAFSAGAAGQEITLKFSHFLGIINSTRNYDTMKLLINIILYILTALLILP